MSSMMKMKQRHDRELDNIKRTVTILYEKMGSPYKPDKITKHGKFGAESYHDVPLSLDAMLDKMLKVEFE